MNVCKPGLILGYHTPVENKLTNPQTNIQSNQQTYLNVPFLASSSTLFV